MKKLLFFLSLLILSLTAIAQNKVVITSGPAGITSNIYTADGNLLGNRRVNGVNLYSLNLDSLIRFTGLVKDSISLYAIDPSSNVSFIHNDPSFFNQKTIVYSDGKYSQFANFGSAIIMKSATADDSQFGTIASDPTEISFGQTEGKYSFQFMNQANDTTTYKPVGMDVNGIIKRMDGWAGGGGGSVLSRTNITSGTSSTVSSGNRLVQFNFASVAATYTLTLPASPSDQDIVEIQTGRTITAPNVEITSFTLSANAGQSLNFAVTPTTLNSGETIKVRYNSSGTFWDRLR